MPEISRFFGIVRTSPSEAAAAGRSQSSTEPRTASTFAVGEESMNFGAAQNFLAPAAEVIAPLGNVGGDPQEHDVLRRHERDATLGAWKLAYTLQAGLNLGVPYTIDGYPTGQNPKTALPWTLAIRPAWARPYPYQSVQLWTRLRASQSRCRLQ